MKRAYVPAIVVYPGDSLSDAAQKAMNSSSYAESRVQLNQYSLFSDGNPYFRKWPYANNNKAIAYGCRERWGMNSGLHTVTSPQTAVVKSLQRCLKNVTTLAKSLNIKCGCRVMAFNDTVFVNPEEMGHRSALPAVIMLVKKGENTGNEMSGLIKSDGSMGTNMPLSFHNEKGKRICTGLKLVNILT